VPLVLAALSGWQTYRLYLALDSSMLWNRAVHASSRGRLLWTSSSSAVGSVGAWQRHGGVQGVQTCVMRSPFGYCLITRMSCY
jgi:hypothetical protein